LKNKSNLKLCTTITIRRKDIQIRTISKKNLR
jgi:hypothetical protein